jgi:hypothetical protein
MIRKIGFRRILPIVQLAIFLGLVFLGAASYQHEIPHEGARLRSVALQLNPAHPQIQIRAEPIEWRFATLLNFPAIGCGAVLMSLMRRQESELYLLLLSMPFVPLVWTLIGRWLDHQLRYLRRPPRTWVRVLWCSLGIAAAILLLVMLLVSLPKSGGSEGQTWGVLYLLMWAAILTITSITSLARAVP